MTDADFRRRIGDGASALTLPIYLDYQATTPTDPRVLAEMLPYFTDKPGNPHSYTHAYGREAEAAVEQARAQVAALIGAEPREIVFTSGATESNNLALKGLARFAHNKRRHIITLETEHKCVLETAKRLAGEGFELSFAPIDEDGMIDLERLEREIRDDTLVVSVMAAHNEIGVVQPIAEIGAMCRARGVHFHSDCAQAAGKIPIDVNDMNIDLMSLSGHKVYGPKGIGALYVRRRPRVRLTAEIDGGGQERGLRSGTLSPPLCVGLGAACALAADEMDDEAARLAGLRDRLREALMAALPDVRLNGHPTQRLAGNLNLSFDGITAEALMVAMTDLAVSSGSACTSATVEPSHVLRALGQSDDRAAASIRFGLGRFTTAAEIDHAIEHVIAHVEALRAEPELARAAQA